MMKRTIALTLALLMTVSAAAGMVSFMGESEAAEPELPVDVVWFWNVQIFSTATNAEDVRWEFNDGSPALDSRDQGTPEYDDILAANGGDVWNPVHQYPHVKGVDYVLTQTVYNSFEGGSSDSMSSIMRVMGPPTVTFSGEGVAIDPVSVPYDENWISQPVAQPEDPAREGFVFDGWYTDEERTTEYVFSSKVRSDVTLYAKWTAEIVTHTVTVISAEGSVSYTVDDGSTLDSVYVYATGGTTAFFNDADHTVAYDPESSVTEDLTVYAVFISSSVPDEPISPEQAKEWIEQNAVAVVMAAVGSVILIAALYTGRPVMILLAVGLIAIAAIGIFDVVDIPKIIEGFPWRGFI